MKEKQICSVCLFVWAYFCYRVITCFFFSEVGMNVLVGRRGVFGVRVRVATGVDFGLAGCNIILLPMPLQNRHTTNKNYSFTLESKCNEMANGMNERAEPAQNLSSLLKIQNKTTNTKLGKKGKFLSSIYSQFFLNIIL